MSRKMGGKSKVQCQGIWHRERPGHRRQTEGNAEPSRKTERQVKGNARRRAANHLPKASDTATSSYRPQPSGRVRTPNKRNDEKQKNANEQQELLHSTFSTVHYCLLLYNPIPGFACTYDPYFTVPASQRFAVLHKLG